MMQGKYFWNDLYFTNEKEADYYVILNYPRREFFDPSKTLVFCLEPFGDQHTGKWGAKTWGFWANPRPNMLLYVRTHKKELCPVFTQFKVPLKQLESFNFEKKDRISCLCSSKSHDIGHKKRIGFLKFLEKKGFDKIDIYGKDNIFNFKNYVGPIERKDKHLGIGNYKYYFMCENNAENNYATEKFWEPILCETLPLYWGCPNLENYVNENSFIRLKLNDFEYDYNLLVNTMENNEWEKRLSYIKGAKLLGLYHYNLFPTIHRIIHS